MLNPAAIIKQISSLKHATDEFIEERIAKNGIKGLVISHGNILAQLYIEDEQTMTSISSKIGRCKSTLTVLVDKLEKTGLVIRKPDSQDTRVKKLCLTEEGKAFKKTFLAISNELNSSLWQGFTKEEQELLMQFASRMNANLDNYTQNQSPFIEL